MPNLPGFITPAVAILWTKVQSSSDLLGQQHLPSTTLWLEDGQKELFQYTETLFCGRVLNTGSVYSLQLTKVHLPVSGGIGSNQGGFLSCSTVAVSVKT